MWNSDLCELFFFSPEMTQSYPSRGRSTLAGREVTTPCEEPVCWLVFVWRKVGLQEPKTRLLKSAGFTLQTEACSSGNKEVRGNNLVVQIVWSYSKGKASCLIFHICGSLFHSEFMSKCWTGVKIFLKIQSWSWILGMSWVEASGQWLLCTLVFLFDAGESWNNTGSYWWAKKY